MYEELYIRTLYDGRDYMSVQELFFYDNDGDEQRCEEATTACDGISTCADQGADLWGWLREQVQLSLHSAGIAVAHLYFEDERGALADVEIDR